MQAQGRAPVSGGAEHPRQLSRARLFASVAAVVAADQLTKLAVTRTIPEGHAVRVIGDFLVIDHVRNSGAAFGLLRGFAGLLALVAMAGFVVVAVMLWRRPPLWTGVAVALVGGGVAGNLVDRLVRGPVGRGTVVDFIDLRFWPAFNVADSAVTIGAILLVWFGGRDTGHDAGRHDEGDQGRA